MSAAGPAIQVRPPLPEPPGPLVALVFVGLVGLCSLAVRAAGGPGPDAVLFATRELPSGTATRGLVRPGPRPGSSEGDELPAELAEFVEGLVLERPVRVGEALTWRHYVRPGAPEPGAVPGGAERAKRGGAG